MANYSTSATVVLSVNGKQAQNMLSQLEKDAKRLEKGISKASAAGDKATMKKLQSELNATNRMMDQLRGSASTAKQVLSRLDSATPRELQKTLYSLQNQLKGIAHNADEFNVVQGKIRLVQSEMQKLNQHGGLVAETFANLDKATPNQLRMSLKTLNSTRCSAAPPLGRRRPN